VTREPVRADGAAELIRLQTASPPYVAWRDADGALRVHELRPRPSATIGRVSGVVTFPDERLVSRAHAEVTMRVYSDPDAVGVYLLDSGSKHGTEHRTAVLRHGRTVETGRWRDAPHAPARPVQLDAGEHDVRLAGELYVLIGGVPLDEGSTNDRVDIPEPTQRQRDVLVELCRPLFASPDGPAAPASNAEIASRLTPPISQERVSDLLSEMYRRYELSGTKEQRRTLLVDFARRHRLVDASDYR
jgi:hypothetical protein